MNGLSADRRKPPLPVMHGADCLEQYADQPVAAVVYDALQGSLQLFLYVIRMRPALPAMLSRTRS